MHKIKGLMIIILHLNAWQSLSLSPPYYAQSHSPVLVLTYSNDVRPMSDSFTEERVCDSEYQIGWWLQLISLSERNTEIIA